jgi:hypothetical protein
VVHWLSWHCGLDLRAAREKVRVAHALDELPVVRAEFAAGRLSYSKVRAITRVATPANEAELVMYAQHSTAAQTERIVRTYRRHRSPEDETEAAKRLHDEQHFQIDYDDDGAGVVTGRMPPEIVAALATALELARTRMPVDRRGEGGPAGPPRTRGAINVDALAMIVETFLANEPAARDGGDRWMVGVNVDADVLTDDGEPLTVSRRSQTLPRAARRAARFRDRGCRFPGCGERTFVEVHHLRHQSRGGGHEITNVLELCWFHHRLVHEGGWTVRFLEHDEVIAITPGGNVISSTLEPPAKADTTLAERNRASGVAVDETTITPHWWNDPLHLGDIIANLERHDERGDAA